MSGTRFNQVIAYLQAATKGSDEPGLDVLGQLDAIRAFASSLGVEVVGVYQDVSSRLGRRHVAIRPGLQDAVTHATMIDAPIVISDFGRLTGHQADIGNVWAARLEIISVREEILLPRPIALAPLTGRAQHEVELISNRTKTGLRKAKERGVRLGNPVNLPLAGQLGNDANRARGQAKLDEIVQVLRKTPGYEKMSKQQIADLLNKDGVLTSRGSPWGSGTIRRYLKEAKELLDQDTKAHYRGDPNFGRF